MDFAEKIYKKDDSIVFRKIADEFILVPIRQNVGDLESIYTLNETAARIWELIDGRRQVNEIKEILLQEFDVTSTEVGECMKIILAQMEQIGSIKIAP